MADELQALLDRLDREGVQKGEKERERLVSQAQAEAEKILADAKAQAAAMVEKAREECQTLRQKSEESIRQSGRQVLLQLRAQLCQRMENVAARLVKSELTAGATAQILSQLCRAYWEKEGKESRVEALVPAAQLEELKTQVFAALGKDLKENVSLKPDKRLSGGFQLSFHGDQVVYDFSDQALAEAVASHLSPALGALVTQ